MKNKAIESAVYATKAEYHCCLCNSNCTAQEEEEGEGKKIQKYLYDWIRAHSAGPLPLGSNDSQIYTDTVTSTSSLRNSLFVISCRPCGVRKYTTLD